MQVNTFKRSAIALAVVGAFAAGTVIADRTATIKPAGAATAPASAAVVAAAPDAVVALPDFSALVAKHGPAVVQISVMHEGRKVVARGMPDDDDEDALPPQFRGFRGSPRAAIAGPSQGMGSGFIVDANGVILTNAHVVDDADEVTVRLVDKREFKAKVLGKRQDHRHRGDQDRREGPAGGQDRQSGDHARLANGSSRSAPRSASRTP